MWGGSQARRRPRATCPALREITYVCVITRFGFKSSRYPYPVDTP